MDAFEDRYAQYYDLIYSDKDYAAECRFIEEVFNRYSPAPVSTILELGCGTGNHAVHLAQRFRVTGIDLSEAMVNKARQKSDDNPDLDFRVEDIRELKTDSGFDACIAMFAVMNYITATDDILSTLNAVRRNLKPGSLFTFDFWNGLAVLRILPSVRVKEIGDSQRRLIRIAEPELSAMEHICRVHYRMLVFEKDALAEDIRETHAVRYLFPQEISHYLTECGFEVLKICPFLDIDGKADENVWNLSAIAKAV